MTLKENEVLYLIFQEDNFDFNTETRQITKGCTKLECCPNTSMDLRFE